MSPLWLLVFLTWYHLSAGSDTEDVKTSKNTIILQPNDATLRQNDYDIIPMDNYAGPSKSERLFVPNDSDDEDVMIYSIALSDKLPYIKYLYPPAIINDNNNRVKRSTSNQLHLSKYKRSTENILHPEDRLHQNQPTPRNTIYSLLLQAENLDSITNNRLAHSRSPLMNIDSTNKRTAKFHAWGGKRNDADLTNAPPSPYVDVDPADFYENIKNTYNINERKRARFSSWGGKRQEEERSGPKTLPFRPWGGKRDKPDILVWPKYTPFKAWGGKRSESVGFYPPEDQALNNLLKKNNRNRRPRFHSWGGKRNEVQVTPAQMTPQLEENDESDTSFSFGDKAEKRARFNAWGGKRSPEIADLKLGQIGDYKPYKKSFHSWGGKRTSTSTEPEVTDDEISLSSFYI